MTKFNPDLLQCSGRTGPTPALLCDSCEGKCPLCNSPVNSEKDEPAYLCGECSFGQTKDKCIMCGNIATHRAYYCHTCVLLGKDRNGCPRIINVGINRSDRYYEKRRQIIVNDTH